MTINFGTIFAFDVSNLFIRLIPNVFLSRSVLFFAGFYFPNTVTIYLDAPKTMMTAYISRLFI